MDIPTNILAIRPRRIAILRALKLGDLLCAVPAFRALRMALPEAHISLVGLPWSKAFAERFQMYIDDFIEFPGFPGLPEIEPRLEDIPTFFEQMQERNFDLAIQMHGSGSITNAIIAMFGARLTAGYYLHGEYQPNNDFFLAYPADDHEVVTHLKLMQVLGVPTRGVELEFPLNEDDCQAAQEIQMEYNLKPKRYAVLHPGSISAKRWPASSFAEVGRWLNNQGLKVVLTGSSGEAVLAQEVNALLDGNAANLAGQTNLGALAGIVNDARFVLCNDTGVSHLAAALSIPSIVLYISSDPRHWAPLDFAIHKVVEGADQVSPEQVTHMIEDLIEIEHAAAY